MSAGEQTSSWAQWLRAFAPAPAGVPRLFCFPHAGGSAAYFLPLAKLLAPRVEVLAVQYPGRQDRRGEQHLRGIPEFRSAIADVLHNRVGGRYAFLGHSLGAVVAFEVARELELREVTGPVRLFASGRRAPSRYRREDVHLRDRAGVLAELAALDSGDPAWLREPELVALFLPTIRCDYRAIETYQYTPGPPLSCPVTALAGDGDPRVSLEDAHAWRAHSAPGFDLRVYSGGHFFLGEHWPGVADLVRTELLAARAGSAAGSSSGRAAAPAGT